MRTIDLSPIKAGKTFIEKLNAQIQGVSKYGFSWLNEMKAQEVIVQQLGKNLDNKHFLLRNAVLPGLDDPIPFILVAPSGLTLIYTSGIKGVFRAKGENWSEMNRTSRQYIPARDNPFTRIQRMVRVVEEFLTGKDCPHPAIQTMIIFPDPGTHIESARPVVRIVLRDALERYILSLLQAQPEKPLSPEETQKIVDLISNVTPEKNALVEQHTLDERKRRKAAQEKAITGVEKKFRLTKKQWMILGIMLGVYMLVLIGFIVVAFLLL
jgi:hypothetical protein